MQCTGYSTVLKRANRKLEWTVVPTDAAARGKGALSIFRGFIIDPLRVTLEFC